MAPTPLLATKLFAPPARPDAVPRPGLVARLEAGARGRLTVVAAPAGFGKSTLVSAWTARTRLPVAWLSLDADDNDPVRFLSYLTAALHRIGIATAVDVVAGPELLRSSQLERA
ncbi:MAG: hypothetical protein P1P87_06270, partial [Trueperaceae bacterium]|nr:hypothetical protein [Trueperaceae bacterium]